MDIMYVQIVDWVAFTYENNWFCFSCCFQCLFHKFLSLHPLNYSPHLREVEEFAEAVGDGGGRGLN